MQFFCIYHGGGKKTTKQLCNPEGGKITNAAQKQGKRQMVHNEVNKLFYNSLIKAAKDVLSMWILFCAGGRVAVLVG